METTCREAQTANATGEPLGAVRGNVRGTITAVLEGQLPLLVQHNAQECTVDVEPAFVVNESEFLEFAHKKIHSRPCRANHFCQVSCDILRISLSGWSFFP